MRASLVDSQIFGSSWRDDRVASLFDEERKIAGWCAVIAAIAECQEAEGILPLGVGTRISEHLSKANPDPKELAAAYGKTGHSLAGLIEVVSAGLGPDAGYLCFGATVQDVTDTWMSLTLKECFRILFRELLEIESELTRIAERHRHTPMLGRTHGQAGAPITMGFKAAVWMQELRRSAERFRQCLPRAARVQLAGSVGALSAFGESGPRLRARLAEKLGLEDPSVSWTSSRDGWTELVGNVAIACSTLEKIAREIYNLQRSEIAELAEGADSSQIGSITMPQKRNPETCEQIGTLARLVRHDHAALMEGLAHDHERDGRSWKAEWALLPSSMILASACFSLSRKVVGRLEIDSTRMLANITSQRGLPMSESLMMALARPLGLASARKSVANLARTVAQGTATMREALDEDPSLSSKLDSKTKDEVFDPRRQIGSCEEMIDASLRESTAGLGRDKEFLSSLFPVAGPRS